MSKWHIFVIRKRYKLKQTKKARAFKLFTQGFIPSSPEIKAIGLYESNRYKYFYEWRDLGKPEVPVGASKGKPVPVGSKSTGGETIGGVDETKAKPKEQKPEAQSGEVLSQGEQIPEGVEEAERGEVEEELEKPKAKDEGIGIVSEVVTLKGKDGKPEGPERKMATTIADDGIKCTVLLSLQTLALFRIAATTQAQFDGGGELSLGDFLDTCAEDFFRVRGKKLGLVITP